MHLTEIHFDHESKGRSHIEVIDVFKNVYLTKTAHTLLKRYLLENLVVCTIHVKKIRQYYLNLDVKVKVTCDNIVSLRGTRATSLP